MANTNFLFGRYTFDPPAPLVKGRARKVSVASIKEFGITGILLGFRIHRRGAIALILYLNRCVKLSDRTPQFAQYSIQERGGNAIRP